MVLLTIQNGFLPTEVPSDMHIQKLAMITTPHSKISPKLPSTWRPAARSPCSALLPPPRACPPPRWSAPRGSAAPTSTPRGVRQRRARQPRSPRRCSPWRPDSSPWDARCHSFGPERSALFERLQEKHILVIFQTKRLEDRFERFREVQLAFLTTTQGISHSLRRQRDIIPDNQVIIEAYRRHVQDTASIICMVGSIIIG